LQPAPVTASASTPLGRRMARNHNVPGLGTRESPVPVLSQRKVQTMTPHANNAAKFDAAVH
jgi:hypothetical protein